MCSPASRHRCPEIYFVALSLEEDVEEEEEEPEGDEKDKEYDKDKEYENDKEDEKDKENKKYKEGEKEKRRIGRDFHSKASGAIWMNYEDSSCP